jgi:histidinol-phosphate phosphatase family protein
MAKRYPYVAKKKNRTAENNRAVFLDRDGTIVEERGYISDPDKIMLEPNTIPALKLFKRFGFRLIITTNQSGIARKIFNKGRLYEVHKKLETLLTLNGIHLDAIYYCPHRPEEKCRCRKPKIGMALGAKRKFNIDLKNSFSIGDKLSDVQFAKNFGGKGILVLTGFGKKERLRIKDEKLEIKPDFIADDIYDAAKWVADNVSKK